MAPLRYAAKFDPCLSLDCARVEGVGAQSKERKGSNFVALAERSHSPEARRANCLQSKNLAIAIWQPCLEVLVGAARGDERRVGRDVHGGDGQLVAVQREEELEGVGEEHLEIIEIMVNGQWYTAVRLIVQGMVLAGSIIQRLEGKIQFSTYKVMDSWYH